MRVVYAAGVTLLVMTAPVAAQQPPATQVPDAAAVPAAPAGPLVVIPRTFTAPVGLIFNTVRPERVADFEKLVGYLQAALTTSTDATIRLQAQGWKVLKASEPGPNGSVLYVFVLDPAAPGVDYGLGRILADAYPDTAKLQEIWKLYTESVTTGGSLLNLTPVQPPAPEAESLVPAPRMLPPK